MGMIQKCVVVFLVLVACWYVFAFTYFPRIGTGPVSPSLTAINIEMQNYAKSDFSYQQMQKNISQVNWQPDGNQYIPELIASDTGSWTLLARPAKKKLYAKPFWKRILFIDFRKYGYPTIKIQPGDSGVEYLWE